MKLGIVILLLPLLGFARIPEELSFLASLLPKSEFVTSGIMEGPLSGTVYAAYRGDESAKTVAERLEAQLGSKFSILSDDSKSAGVAKRLEAIYGQLESSDTFKAPRMLVRIFIFQLVSDGNRTRMIIVTLENEN